MRISILTWNIHKAIGGVDRRYRPERVIETIAHYNPDVALLQEVDEGARRSRYHRQVDRFGDALDMRHRAFVPNHKLRVKGHYGNAILSRWPLYDIHNVDLTIGARKRRSALYSKTRVRIGRRTRTLVLYNLHLGLSSGEREGQLQRLFGSHPFAHHHRRTPVVVAGDFNDDTGTLGEKVLGSIGLRQVGSRVGTFPAVMPVRALDGIFVGGDLNGEHLIVPRLQVAKRASDHLPLIAEVSIYES